MSFDSQGFCAGRPARVWRSGAMRLGVDGARELDILLARGVRGKRDG